MPVLKQGSTGAEVTELQLRLRAAGFDPGDVDGKFGEDTRTALLAFQNTKGLPPDGKAGTDTLKALGIDVTDTQGSPVSPPVTTPSNNIPSTPGPSVLRTGTGVATASAFPAASVSVVAKMFPGTPIANIQANLPIVLQALSDVALADKEMVLMALGTIRAETASFRAISEGISKFNTTPGRHPFNLYDKRTSLGNLGRPDGARFKGRGFVPLTGRDNYRSRRGDWPGGSTGDGSGAGKSNRYRRQTPCEFSQEERTGDQGCAQQERFETCAEAGQWRKPRPARVY